MKTTADILREATPDMQPHILLGAYSALLDMLTTEVEIARKYNGSKVKISDMQKIVDRFQAIERVRNELRNRD